MATALQTVFALVHVSACKSFAGVGFTGQYTLVHLPGNAAQTSASLWMIPLAQSETYGRYMPGLNAQSKAEAFEIALQTGFTGAVCAGDSISYGGDVYQVQDVERDQSGAIFTCRCTLKTARTLGAA